MGELIMFPNRERGHVVIAWHLYHVEAVSAVGYKVDLKYRAMNPHSAAARARRDGYTPINVTRETEETTK